MTEQEEPWHQGTASSHGAGQEPLAASAGSALSPKHSPGRLFLLPSKQPLYGHFKVANAEGMNLNDISNLSLPVLR